VRIFTFDAAKEPIVIRSGYRHARREKGYLIFFCPSTRTVSHFQYCAMWFHTGDRFPREDFVKEKRCRRSYNRR